jgi:putative transposase
MVTYAAKRAAVATAREAHGISERRACLIPGADRTSVRYAGRRGDDAPLRARLRALAGESQNIQNGRTESIHAE